MDSVYGIKDFAKVIEDFQVTRERADGIGLIITGGENKIPPKTLLRAYHNDDIEHTLLLAGDLVRGKQVQLVEGDKVLLSFIHEGGPIEDHFGEDNIWLLDTFTSMCRGIMLKKLTPPSKDSGKQESGSEE